MSDHSFKKTPCSLLPVLSKLTALLVELASYATLDILSHFVWILLLSVEGTSKDEPQVKRLEYLPASNSSRTNAERVRSHDTLRTGSAGTNRTSRRCSHPPPRSQQGISSVSTQLLRDPNTCCRKRSIFLFRLRSPSFTMVQYYQIAGKKIGSHVVRG